MIYDHPLIAGLYRRSPVMAQNMLVSAYGLRRSVQRAGRVAREFDALLQESQFWTASRLREHQNQLLQGLIRHAYENVPYYHRVFSQLHLKPADIQTAADLYKLPVLRKEYVRQFNEELKARNISKTRVTVGRTGGTTGVPLHFLLDSDRVIFDHCLTDRQWAWAGFRTGDRVVILRGLTLIPGDSRSKFWRFDWIENRIYLSGFHLSRDTASVYIKKLQEWKPRFIAAYPSSAFTLARFMEQAGIVIPVTGIFTSSEVLTPTERKLIEQQFACRVWDRYGTGERLAVAQQCEHGSYHQNEEFGIMQVDAPAGQPAVQGKKGELIQTGLTNYSMPLIRYATGDLGSFSGEECSCGRALPVMGPVDGRKDDVIVTADGRLMPRAGLDQIHEFVENLERCQLFQERVGELVVRVVPLPGFGVADENELKTQLQKRIGPGTAVKVLVTDHLPLTAQGKERFIVSMVDAERVSGMESEPHRQI